MRFRRIHKKIISVILVMAILTQTTGISELTEIFAYSAGEDGGNEVNDSAGVDDDEENMDSAGGGTAQEDYNEDVSEGVVNGEAKYSDLSVDEEITLTANMDVGNLTVTGYNTINLNGYVLTVHEDCTIKYGRVEFNGGHLICEGNLNIDYSGETIVMNDDNDYLEIDGSLICASSCSSVITAGTIEIKGDINGDGSSDGAGIETSGTCRMILSGQEKQTLFFSKYANIEYLEIQNPEGVYAKNAIPACNLVDNGYAVDYSGDHSDDAVMGWTLTADETWDGDLYIKGGKLDLNGHKLTVNGIMYLVAGDLVINGGELYVDGSLLITGTGFSAFSAGRLVMTNAEDVVTVSMDFYMGSVMDHEGLLSAGTMNIKGNFYRYTNFNEKNFCTTGTHKVVFNGTAGQTIHFNYPEDNYNFGSAFSNILFENSSEEGVILDGDVYVKGKAKNEITAIQGSTVLLSGASLDGIYKGDITITTGCTLTDDMHVAGNMDMIAGMEWGEIRLGGHELEVEGDINIHNAMFYVDGGNVICHGDMNVSYAWASYNGFYMTNPDDYMLIYGNLNYGAEFGGDCTEGVIELKGDFCIYPEGSVYAGLTMTGNSRILLSGDKLQTITTEDRNIRFNIIELANTSEEGVQFADTFDYSELITNSCRLTLSGSGSAGWKLEQDTVVDGDLYIGMGTMNLNGHTLTVMGDYIQANGRLELNGGTLHVEGDMRLQSMETDEEGQISYSAGYASIVMDSDDDTIIIDGNLVVRYNGSSFEMDAGAIYVAGDITQEEMYGQITASGTHRLVLNGTGTQTLDMQEYYYLTFNIIEVENQYRDRVYCKGGLTYNGLDISLPCIVFEDGSYAGWKLSADTLIDEDMTIRCGGLDMNGHTLTIEGNLTMDGGYLIMDVTSDVLIVEGDFEFNSFYGYGNNYEIIAGTIYVAGDFVQSGSETIGFFAGGTNKVVLNGTTSQTIRFQDYKSYFNILYIANESDEGVCVTGGLRFSELVTNDNIITSADGGIFGWTLTEDTTIDSSLVLLGGKLDLNGHTLTINGSLVHKSGDIIINSGSLIVNGNYRMYIDALNVINKTNNNSYGRLYMQQESDYVCVTGDLTVATNADSVGCLTAGVLEVKGNVSQINTYIYNNFVSENDFTLKLTGENVQYVSIASYTYSTLANIEFNNTSDGGVNLSTQLYVKENIRDISRNVGGTITVNSLNSVSDVFSGNIIIGNSCLLDRDKNILGQLTVNGNGVIDMGGHSLTAKNISLTYGEIYVDGGSLTTESDLYIDTSGRLNMTNDSDYVAVGGSLTTKSSWSHENLLTEGTLVIRENFYETSSYNKYTFCATGNHKTIFLGRPVNGGIVYVQNVSFAHPGYSRFNILVLTKPTSYYSFDSDVNDICNTLEYDMIDIQVPTKVEGVNAAAILTTQLTLSWQASTDDSAVAEYRVYRDNELIATTELQSFTDTSLLPETTYIYRISAVDDAGNVSEYSDAISITTAPDTQAPDIPKDLRVLRRSGSSIVLGWQESEDNVGCTGYKLYRDDELIAVLETTEYKDENVALVTGYNYEVTAIDAAGNESERSGTVTGYAAAPVIMSVSPENYSEFGADGTTIKVFFADNGNSVGNTVVLEYAREGSGDWITLTDEPLTQKKYSQTQLYVSYKWDTSRLVSGDYNVRCTLYDEDGNQASRQVTYTIDTNGPDVVENLAANADNGNIVLTWEQCRDADCAYYIIYRGVNYSDFIIVAEKLDYRTVSYTDKDVIAGVEYMYAIVPVDKLGNEGDISDFVRVTATEDESEPFIVGIDNPGRIGDSGRFKVTAYDNKAVDKILLQYYEEESGQWTDIGEESAANSSAEFVWRTDGLADGVYNIRAIAWDMSGNSSSEDYIAAVTIDKTGPDKPVINRTSSSSTIVTIGWENFTDDDFSYAVVEKSADGGVTFTTSGKASDVLGANITDLIPDTEYIFRVVGYDDVGNRGVESDNIIISTAPDDVSPVVTNFSPQQSAYNKTIAFEITASDNYSVSMIKLYYSQDNENWEPVNECEGASVSKTLTMKYNLDLSVYPEGLVYFKTMAVDKAGNASTEVTAVHKVDRTAPEEIVNLYATAEPGYVALTWSAKDEDIDYYIIYRAEFGEEEFEIIENECRTLNYYDTSIDFSTEYTYKLRAVDIAGNISDYSNMTTVTALEDNEAPVIYGMLPGDNYTIGANETIKVVVYDACIDSVKLEYKSAGEEIWRTIGEKEAASKMYDQIAFTWNTDGLNSGDYTMRAIAKDSVGNISDPYIQTYTLDKDAPEAGTLRTEADNFQIHLMWDESESDDVDHYVLYRKAINETDYSAIRTTTGMEYIDKDINTLLVYMYRVEYVDKCGNSQMSNVVFAIAGDTDTQPPVISVNCQAIVRSGYEFSLDASDSTDNVGIVSFVWDMGDGNKVSGARPRYTYDEPGEYTCVLTAADAAGNHSKKMINIVVLDGNTSGTYNIQVTGEDNKPINNAIVYLYDEEEGNRQLETDSDGRLTICSTYGEHRIAIYKQGYLPMEHIFEINSAISDETNVIRLSSGKVVAGTLDCHRMDIAEMIEAGVDIDNADNYNSYMFTVSLKFAQQPIPTVYEVVILGDGSESRKEKIDVALPGSGKPTTSLEWPDLNIEFFEVETTGQVNEPIFAYINTSAGITWLKEIYSVDLGIINCASPQFVLTDCEAALNIPDGLELAAMNDGEQDTMQKLDDIAGQSSSSVSWYLAGCESGEYSLTADFSSRIQPFDTPVNVTFKSQNSINVELGEGLCIYVMPESAAYIGEEYYIQYMLVNESDRIFYNVSTTFGNYQEPEQINDIKVEGEGEPQTVPSTTTIYFASTGVYSGAAPRIPIVTDGGTVYVGVFYPGAVIRGTYKTTFNAEGDYDEVYYELINQKIEDISSSNKGVKVVIKTMPSHITKYNVETIEVDPTYGDPVNMATGAFTDSLNVMSVSSCTDLEFNLFYDSLNTESGQMGYGWYNAYESRIVEENGVINLYMTPQIFATFLSDDKISRKVSGKLEDSTIILDMTDDGLHPGEYSSISTGMDDYKLYRYEDGSWELTLPSGVVWGYDNNGRLVRIIQTDNTYVDIEYGTGSMTVTDPVTGKYLLAGYGVDGLVTWVSDYAGRKTNFTYENGMLTKVTNAIGESIYYEYDENRRLAREYDSDGKCFVANEYDGEGRVVSQDDGLESTPLTYYSYSVDRYGRTKTTATDRNGNEVVYYSDSLGHITGIINQNSDETTYTYDAKGNNTSITDGSGESVSYIYDEKGNVTAFIDSRNFTTSMEYDANGNVIKMTLPGNGSSTYIYDENNRITSCTDNTGMTITYTYDADGNILTETTEGLGTISYTYEDGLKTSMTDYEGNTTTYEYDVYANMTREIYADGSYTAYTYDLLSRIITASDAAGNTIYYTYDCRGNTTGMTDRLGNGESYEYDGNNRLVKSTDKMGNVMTYEYDNEGNCTRTAYADGTSTVTEYDGAGNAVKVTAGDGSVTLYEYDGSGRVTKQTQPGGGCTTYSYLQGDNVEKVTFPDGSYTQYMYDAGLNITAMTDNSGAVVKYTYDAAGNMQQIKDAAGNSVFYDYDAYGRMSSYTDANGNMTSYTYDANGNCTEMLTADGTQTVYTYDTLNRLVKSTVKTSDGDISVSYTYDMLGRLNSYTDAEGNTFATHYDAMGNVTSVEDAYGRVTQVSEYDAYGNVAKTTDALGVVSEYEYDVMGRLSRVTAYAGTDAEETTTYAYDAIGQIISVMDAENGVSSQTYDADGNVTSVTDPNGGTSTYTYDIMGRVVSQTDAIGGTCSYTYNSSGLLETYTDAKEQETVLTYDELGRVVSMTDSLGTISYTYDTNGNVLTVTDESGTISREYDCMNRVTKYTDCRGNTVSYGYDELGNLISLTYPGGEIVRYEYYPTGRLKKVMDSEGRVTSYIYDANGLITCMSRPDGSTETYEYDAKGQLLKQTDVNGENVVQSIEYTWDEAGNITNIKTTIGEDESGTDSGTTAISSISMEYNAINQLISYNGEKVLYDANGNMTYGPLNGEMAYFTYDCRNRLISAGDTTYEYDAEDNRTAVVADGVRTEYVVENNAAAVSQVLTATVTDAGDGAGTDTEPDGGTDTVAETSYGGADTKGDTTLYVYGNGLITQKNNTGGLWVYHFNNIGSTTAITDEEGNILYNYAYGTYGELLSGNADATPFLYNGKMGVMTDNNGLYYMRARYYNTDIKRFINRDILSGNIADGKSLNNYAYCEGNPVSLADPFGLSPNINWSGLIHFALDMASMIPGVGIAFNVINMELYWMEGDTDALKLHALLGASFIGNAVGKAASLLKLTKTANVITALGKTVSFGTYTYLGKEEFDKSFSSLKYGLAHGQLDFKNLVKSVGYGYMTVHGGIATVTSAAELGVAVGQAAVAGKQAISSAATKAAQKANSALKKAESGLKDIHNNNGGFVNLNAGETSYGKSIVISEKKMYQLGYHYNKHGRNMGFSSKKEYEQAARDFFEQYRDVAEIYEGTFNNAHGKNVDKIQTILRYGDKQLIISKESGQLIDFYEGTSLKSFINVERIQ